MLPFQIARMTQGIRAPEAICALQLHGLAPPPFVR
jgi:hypothetical protein